MFPIKHSSIFKSRWMALLWAAGIIWFAYDFAKPSENAAKAGENAAQMTDVTGAPVSPDEAKKVGEILKNL